MSPRRQRVTFRAERVAEAQRLRAQGLKLREICERMGVARATADGYLNDPDLSKLRARKERYARPCAWCGGPTDGSGGYANPRSICQSCRNWEPEAIIDAIRRWADEHGGVPPTCTEWQRAGTSHPSAHAVVNRLGWNEALLRAGFGLKCDRRPETQAWIMEQLNAGVPTREIANALGVTERAISERLKNRGTTITAIRRAAA